MTRAKDISKILTDADLSGTLEITKGASGASANAAADELVLQNSGDAGLSILSPNANNSQILLGSPVANAGGIIRWTGDDNAVKIGTNNTGSTLRFHVGGFSEVMRISSAGNVGIGTASPTTALTLGTSHTATVQNGGSNSAPAYAITSGALGTNGITAPAANSLGFVTASTERMRIDANGEVTIQGDAKKLIFGASADSDMAHYADGQFAFRNTDAQGFVFYTGAGPTERMRIDSSGNLLVGKTSSGIATAGIELRANDDVLITSNGSQAVYLNRLSSDGVIAELRKDGTEIGRIGSTFTSSASRLFISNGNTGVHFNDATSQIIPCTNTGAKLDNAIDLGNASGRYDQVFATNPNINTSDRNEKQDIEELTDAEQRVAVVAKGLMRKFRWKDKVAEKGDNARTHFGIIAQDLQDAFTAEGLDAGDYAMFCSDTWWELDGETYYTEEEAPDDATQKTRLGVRYSELLAFIISAI